jgi:hypothetical protein
MTTGRARCLPWLALPLLAGCSDGCDDTDPGDDAGPSASSASSASTSTGSGGGGGAGGQGPVAERVRFAAIGDFGFAAIGAEEAADEAEVAALVSSWAPELVVTVGDNNYPDGGADTIDLNIGQFYHAFIAPYVGSYGQGASENRFFPALGNHDWNLGNVDAHRAYFELPGNERYWDMVRGPVHLFFVDSDPHEPDGITARSTQGQWLQGRLAASESPFRVVLFHHPPYSSGEHGSNQEMRWPFAEWGADLVLAGHDHGYERLAAQGIPFVVNGMGGADLRAIGAPIPESQVRFDGDHGAMLFEVDRLGLTAQAIIGGGQIIDAFSIHAPEAPAGAALLAAGSTWRYLDDGSDLGEGWRAAGFDDAAWKAGAAPLGYGEDGLATELGYGPSSDAKFITTYLRTRFTVENAAAVEQLLLELVRDDGAAVFLNGVEVLRSNLPSGATAGTAAIYTVADVAESARLLASVDASLLVEGENVIAVELHQAAPGSSDLRFDLALRAVP